MYLFIDLDHNGNSCAHIDEIKHKFDAILCFCGMKYNGPVPSNVMLYRSRHQAKESADIHMVYVIGKYFSEMLRRGLVILSRDKIFENMEPMLRQDGIICHVVTQVQSLYALLDTKFDCIPVIMQKLKKCSQIPQNRDKMQNFLINSCKVSIHDVDSVISKILANRENSLMMR